MSKKTKVCVVSTSPILSKLLTGSELQYIGGAEVQQTLIADMLIAAGCEVSVLVHDLGQPDEMVTEEGVRLIKAYPASKSIRHILMPWTHPLWKAMKLADADIYYQRATGSVTGAISLACRLLRRPFIHATSIDIDLDGTKEKGLNPLKRALYRHGIRSAAVVVVQTEQQEALLRRRFRRDGFIIPNAFAAAEPTGGVERNLILWVGSFRDHKRPGVFVDLAERLPDLPFLMVGGPFMRHPELFVEVKNRAESMPNIKVAGLVPYHAIGECFDRAKLFVCTSTMEGFPNTFLQSWSRGVPVISTFDPDGVIAEHCLGHACSDFEELVEAVELLAADDALRGQIGKNAVEYVESHHGQAAVGRRYKELISMLSNGAPSGKEVEDPEAGDESESGNDPLAKYFAAVEELGLYSSGERLGFYLEHVFPNIDFRGKNVLDIGAGKGLCSFYAASKGASKVVSLEPEAAGSTEGSAGKFRSLGEKLGLEQVTLVGTTLQNFEPGDEKFDVIILDDCVNHLDEQACIALHRDESSRETYRGLFEKMHGMASDDAVIIMTDASRYNFFGLFGLRSPFYPRVDWKVHQSPVLWSRLLMQAGFSKPNIRWRSFNRLGPEGRAFLGNKAASFFTGSRFCLTASKKPV